MEVIEFFKGFSNVTNVLSLIAFLFASSFTIVIIIIKQRRNQSRKSALSVPEKDRAKILLSLNESIDTSIQLPRAEYVKIVNRIYDQKGIRENKWFKIGWTALILFFLTIIILIFSDYKTSGDAMPITIIEKPTDFIVETNLITDGVDKTYFIEFTLSNIGKGLVEVKEISLISDFTKCTELHLDNKGALTNEYNYKLSLSPDTARQVVDNRSFNYKENDIDKFSVKLTSNHHGYFNVSILIKYTIIGSSEIKHIQSKSHKIHFNTVNPDEYLKGELVNVNSTRTIGRYDFFMVEGNSEDALMSALYENNAVKYFNNQEYLKAYSYIQKSITLSPYSVSSLLNKGVIEIKLDKVDNAIVSFEKLVSVHRNSKKGWFYLGVLYDKIGENEKSKKAFLNSKSINEVDLSDFMKSEIFHINMDEWDIVSNYYKKQNCSETYGNFIDNRDGKNYKTVEIGNQIWMAENLAYDLGDKSLVYNNNTTNIDYYGYLYDWETAKNACPSGWHLPSSFEIEELLVNQGWNNDFSIGYQALKENGSSCFNALFGGCTYNDTFTDMGLIGIYWASNTNSENIPYALSLMKTEKMTGVSNFPKKEHASVRCIKNN